MSQEQTPVGELHTTKVQQGQGTTFLDAIAIEAPLEIKLTFIEEKQKKRLPLAITMRTPGQDRVLAAGYLFTEGIIGNRSDITNWQQIGNTLQIELAPHISPSILEDKGRATIAHASCGICGKPSLDSLERISCYYPQANFPIITPSFIHQLPPSLLQTQASFKQTGGMHAAAFFQTDGSLSAFQEDIGRHNALDKLIGWAVMNQLLPLREQILFLSGRISFELVQKASFIGIPIIAAVGAPSTLAIELAETSGITLIGFVKEDRFNIYCGEERVIY